MPHNKQDCLELGDEELVKKSKENIEYFVCIFERYEKKLIRYILRISSFSHAEAEDVLQEAFVKIWQNLNEFDDNLKFSSWAYRIIHNTTIAEWKKTQSKGRHQKQELDEDLFGELPSSLNIEQELGHKIDRERIHKILNLMPEKYKDVLILRYLEEKNYDEISDILRKPPGTVATLLNRAKKSFYAIAEKENMTFTI